MLSRSHISSAPDQTRVHRATKLGKAPCYITRRPADRHARAPGARQANFRGVIENEQAGAQRRF